VAATAPICTGLEYIDKEGSRHTVALAHDGEVILSCGAVNSPQVLLRSGIGCP
jgi:choline dehydrogenase-like flavoprotein